MENKSILYKRTKTSAIQYWRISIYPIRDANNAYVIEKESGQLNTESPMIHKETVSKGKQGRNQYEQAISQGTSDWRKKKDEGYKDLHDLGIVATSEAAGNFTILGREWGAEEMVEQLNKALPQFNTDASGNVKPMLAKDWKVVKSIIYPAFAQPKLDGVRCLAKVSMNSISLTSRNGKPYNIPHLTEILHTNYVLDYGLSDYNPFKAEFILDGEIYSEELSFQAIVAAVKKTNEDTPKLKMRVYDMVSEDKQVKRIVDANEYIKAIASPYFTEVETVLVYSNEDVKRLHDKWVLEGNEGAMIRHLEGLYGQGQRSSDLLKVKEFDETEFVFEYLEQGQREEDLIAVCRMPDGQKFSAKIMGNKAWKQQLKAECGDLQETMLTVKHFGYTNDGLPRFPIGKSFRDYE